MARIFQRIGLVLVAALFPIGLAGAHEPMSFTLGRLEETPACGGKCAEFIVAKGEIGFSSVIRYLGARGLSGDRNLPIILESPGGFLTPAQMLARVWRLQGATVIVARVQPTCEHKAGSGACAPVDRSDGVRTFAFEAVGDCASGCIMLLAGGLRRLAAPRARLGVHHASLDQGAGATQFAKSLGANEKQVEKDIMERYRAALTEYGVAAELGARAARTPAASMDWFGRDAARGYNLVNATTGDLADQPSLAEILSHLEHRWSAPPR